MLSVLLSHERSGSHLVGEFITDCGALMLDEVCNPNAVSPFESPISFPRYELDWANAHRETYLKPAYRDRLAMVSDYFARLAATSSRDTVVDIKYGHLVSFEYYWKPPFARPIFFEVLEKSGIKLIFLHRRNVLETAVSAAIAERRRIWHSWEESDRSPKGETFELDPWPIAAEANLLRLQNEWIGTKWLGKVEALDLIYEDVVASLSGGSDSLDRLAAFLGVKRRPEWSPRLKKLGRPLSEQIANWDEFRKVCERQGLGEYLGE